MTDWEPIKENTPRREFVTDVLDESRWPDVLKVIIGVLGGRGIASVKAEFGYIFERDVRGEKQLGDVIVSLDALPSFFQAGFGEGSIEWGGGSDFVFSPVGIDLKFMLCNDADLHYYSADPALLADVTRWLLQIGIRVYESGEPVMPVN